MDDRPPTLYFKIKTHEDQFITTIKDQMEIYLYNMGPKELSEIARPIINHKNSITTQSSYILRKLITPIITTCPYLTKYVYQTISSLCQDGYLHIPIQQILKDSTRTPLIPS